MVCCEDGCAVLLEGVLPEVLEGVLEDISEGVTSAGVTSVGCDVSSGVVPL